MARAKSPGIRVDSRLDSGPLPEPRAVPHKHHLVLPSFPQSRISSWDALCCLPSPQRLIGPHRCSLPPSVDERRNGVVSVCLPSAPLWIRDVARAHSVLSEGMNEILAPQTPPFCRLLSATPLLVPGIRTFPPPLVSVSQLRPPSATPLSKPGSSPGQSKQPHSGGSGECLLRPWPLRSWRAGGEEPSSSEPHRAGRY